MTEVTERVYQYGSSQIPYSLVFRDRQTLAIEVRPDSSVHVKAPLGADLEAVEAKLRKRAAWIRRQQQAFSEYPAPLPRRRYVTGESYRYLGKQYRLKVVEADTKKVRLWRGHIELWVTHGAGKEVKARLLNIWFRERAGRVFAERYAVCLNHAKPYGVNPDGGFELRQMPKRWGSCTKDGKLILNPALVSAPKSCIDYVITHELCHTVHHDHSVAFYDLLSRIMPEWEARRTRLNSTVEPLALGESRIWQSG